MTIQVSDHRWTQDTLEQLTVSGPVSFSGKTLSITAGATTLTADAVATVPLTVQGFSAAQTGILLDVFQNGTTNDVFRVATAANAVNGVVITAAATGTNPIIAAGGGGADANLSLVLKGTGTGSVDVAAGGGITGVVQGALIAAAAGIANTDTYVTSFTLIPTATLKAKSRIRITAVGTANCGNASSSVWTVRAGTLGTTGDQLVQAFTPNVAGTAGTEVAFRVVIDMTVRTVGATGTCFGAMTVNTITGGITGTLLSPTYQGTGTNLATTTATKLGLSVISGHASNTYTFQDVSIEVLT